MKTKKEGPKRAVKGTIGGKFLLPLPDEMRADIDKAAEKVGLSSAEWIRQAIQLRLSIHASFKDVGDLAEKLAEMGTKARSQSSRHPSRPRSPAP